MKVLSIDPGYGRCGVAVVSGTANKQECEYSGCIETSSKAEFPDRLAEICAAVRTLIKKYQPDALAIEKIFFNQNTATAMQVAQVKGALILVAKEAGLETYDYGPQEIKIAVVGYGKSPKAQMIQMVSQLVDVRPEAKHDDEYDAIAVGITHLATSYRGK
ncbi:MAG: crossover junction endodeoxyribonuclease RuvC [Candidatus Paceibacterota bacterium]